MTWQERNIKYNSLIRQLFHGEDWQQRAEAARQLGFMKDARAVNIICKALRTEQDHSVINRIIEALGRIGDGKATLRIIEKLKEELDKSHIDKSRIRYIIESLTNINDKRALVYIGQFLNSPDDELKNLAQQAFDTIEPDWRNIIKKEKEEHP